MIHFFRFCPTCFTPRVRSCFPHALQSSHTGWIDWRALFLRRNRHEWWENSTHITHRGQFQPGWVVVVWNRTLTIDIYFESTFELTVNWNNGWSTHLNEALLTLFELQSFLFCERLCSIHTSWFQTFTTNHQFADRFSRFPESRLSSTGLLWLTGRSILFSCCCPWNFLNESPLEAFIGSGNWWRVPKTSAGNRGGLHTWHSPEPHSLIQKKYFLRT